MSNDAATLPEVPALLKAMITGLQAENAKMSATIRAHDQLIQTLRLRIAKLKKQAFSKSSEKVEREIEQLELALEDLLIAAAESHAGPVAENADEDRQEADGNDAPERAPRCRPRVSASTPRERRELDSGTCCPDCMIMAQLKFLQIARLKKSCRRCEKMVQEPAPQQTDSGQHGQRQTAGLHPRL